MKALWEARRSIDPKWQQLLGEPIRKYDITANSGCRTATKLRLKRLFNLDIRNDMPLVQQIQCFLGTCCLHRMARAELNEM